MNDVKHQGWILYDGTCGFCTDVARFWSDSLTKWGFELAPLQRQWVVEQLKLPREELERDLRLLLPDGNQIVGAEAYRHVMARIWWAAPISWLSRLPLLRTIFDRTYRTVADNRHWVSTTCGSR